jgi:hypothetical protein
LFAHHQSPPFDLVIKCRFRPPKTFAVRAGLT